MRYGMLVAIGGLLIVGGLGAAQSREVASPEDFEKAMTDVQGTFGPLRRSIEAGDAAEIASGAQELTDIFAGVQAFWESHGVDEAAGIAKTAHDAAASIKAAADAGDLDAVRPAAQSLGGTCRTCHMAYRERVSDGVFKFKDGVL